MDETEKLIRQYLSQGKMMQLATVSGEQPWICTVYYVEDEAANLYWLSLPDRRHSQEIAKHPQVAVAVPIKFDQPVIGIQAEGRAEKVEDAETIKQVMQRYTARYNAGKQFYDNFIAGKNQHALYKFTPNQMSLFDEQTFGDGIRRDWRLTKGA